MVPIFLSYVNISFSQSCDEQITDRKGTRSKFKKKTFNSAVSQCSKKIRHALNKRPLVDFARSTRV